MSGQHWISHVLTLGLVGVVFSAVSLRTLPPTPTTVSQVDVNRNASLSSPLTQLVTIPPRTTLIFSWTEIPSIVNFVLFQAHTQAIPLLLSYANDLVFGNYVNSTNAGLVVLLGPAVVSATVYITNPSNENITSLLVTTGYNEQAPIPGACNLEFDVEIAPYLMMFYDRMKITVEYQKSNIGYPKGMPAPSCDRSIMRLEYTVYQYFMKERILTEEEYFQGVKEMLSVDSIEKNGLKASTLQSGPFTRAAFNAIPGQGVVFNIIVRDISNSSWRSAYTPAVSYGCDIRNDIQSCDMLIRPFGWIFCVVCAFVGFFLCLFGHRFFKIELFVFGFLTVSLMTFIFVSKYTEANYSVRVSMTILLGIVGGFAWVAFWWFAGVPIFSVLLIGLDLGFLLACVVFYTPLGDLEMMKNDFNYWTTFACILLIPGLFLMCTIQKLSIIGCAVVGSYGTILLLDLYLGTSLVYIILNVMKRAVITDFYLLNTHTPFQISEICLIAVWIFMAIVGICVQVLRERRRSPFPPPPYLTWRMASIMASLVSSRTSSTEEERRPLLNNDALQQDYHTTHADAPSAPQDDSLQKA